LTTNSNNHLFANIPVTQVKTKPARLAIVHPLFPMFAQLLQIGQKAYNSDRTASPFVLFATVVHLQANCNAGECVICVLLNNFPRDFDCKRLYVLQPSWFDFSLPKFQGCCNFENKNYRHK
jgi:hypothetical protein